MILSYFFLSIFTCLTLTAWFKVLIHYLQKKLENQKTFFLVNVHTSFNPQKKISHVQIIHLIIQLDQFNFQIIISYFVDVVLFFMFDSIR